MRRYTEAITTVGAMYRRIRTRLLCTPATNLTR